MGDWTASGHCTQWPVQQRIVILTVIHRRPNLTGTNRYSSKCHFVGSHSELRARQITSRAKTHALEINRTFECEYITAGSLITIVQIDSVDITA